MNHNHHEKNHQHHHEHNHEHNSKISFLMIIRLAISSLMLISTFFIPYTYKIAVVVITVLAWLIAGYDILIEAVENVFHKDFLDENFLMIVASAGALAIGENTEAVLVIILFQIGEYLQGLAVSKSESGIKSLVNLRAEYANLMKDGELIAVKPEEIHTNDQIIVKPGEKIPLDGTVIKGDSFVDTSNLTGESVPRKVKPGDTVLSGCVNGNGELTLSVTSEYKDSTVSVILSLVEDASSGKSKSENFITSFSKIYTPCVVGLALLICVSLPLVYLKTGVPFKESFVYWLHKSLTFLVVSCPCALVISVPLSYFAGIGGASRNGILVKGGNYLDSLCKAQTIVYDKTGTLTKGVFKVTEIKSINKDYSENDILKMCAILEAHSNHPIALSILNECKEVADISLVKNYEVLEGKGIKGIFNDKIMCVGNRSILSESDSFDVSSKYGTCCYLTYDGKCIGYIIISDEIKEEAKDTLSLLKNSYGISNIMLTGDCEEVANCVSEELNLDMYSSNLLPADKVSKLTYIIASKNKGSTVVFVGDGMNDAPVLKAADIGIAMGGIGSDAAIEAADIVIMNDSLSQIPKALNIARKTRKIATENIIFSISIKIIVMVLIIFGIANMYIAVFADVGVCLIAIINSMRALKYNKS